MDVNVIGPVLATQAFGPLLGADQSLKGSKGRIVMISSVAGKNGNPLLAPYSTSKHAIDSGRGVGGVGGGFLPGATLGDVGVSKKSLRASRPSDQTMRAVVPGVQEGAYRNGPASKQPGQSIELTGADYSSTGKK